MKAAKTDEGNGDGQAKTPVEKETPGQSAKLVEELTAHQTMALRAVLADEPVTALTAAVHALAVPLFYDGLAESALDLRATSAWLKAEGIDDGPAAKQLGERHQAWRTQLPEQPEGLWNWLTRQDMQTVIGLLAYCVAATVKPERSDAFNGGDMVTTAEERLAGKGWLPALMRR